MAATNPTATADATHLAQVFAQYPIEVAHGEGVWLYARDGRKILDFYGGHAVAGLGYGHSRWLAALERQARQMAFQTNALPLGIRERAAARLTKFVGLGRPARPSRRCHVGCARKMVRFSAHAVRRDVRAARQSRRRRSIRRPVY